MKPEITRLLTLSTAHVRPETLDTLSKDAENNTTGLVVYKKEDFGYFIYLPTIGEGTCRIRGNGDIIEFGFKGAVPEDLQRLLQYAYGMNCGILCLDCDGPELPYLPVYEHDINEDDGGAGSNSSEPASGFAEGDVVSVNGEQGLFVVRKPFPDGILLCGRKSMTDAAMLSHYRGDDAVVPVFGGKYSLYCRRCKTFTPNTANYEMRKEGCYAYSHSCARRSPLEAGLED